MGVKNRLEPCLVASRVFKSSEAIVVGDDFVWLK